MRVDFYISSQASQPARLQLACRILEKAAKNQHQTFVNMPSQQSAEQLNELLWTFKDTSFIPHALAEDPIEPPPLIQIGYQQMPNSDDILLNLANEIPEFHHVFKRIIEIVSGDATAKQRSRQHYRYYQEQGFDLHTHQIN